VVPWHHFFYFMASLTKRFNHEQEKLSCFSDS